MPNKTTTAIGLATSLAVLASPAVSVAQSVRRHQVRATPRTALLMSRVGLVAEARATTSVVGSVWSLTNETVPDQDVRLRNPVDGDVIRDGRTDHAGDFAFEAVPPGTYLIEVVAQEDGRPMALGDVFTIGPGETVAVFVRLMDSIAAPPALFEGSADAVLSSAVAAGVGPTGGGRPASNEDQPR